MEAGTTMLEVSNMTMDLAVPSGLSIGSSHLRLVHQAVAVAQAALVAQAKGFLRLSMEAVDLAAQPVEPMQDLAATVAQAAMAEPGRLLEMRDMLGPAATAGMLVVALVVQAVVQVVHLAMPFP